MSAIPNIEVFKITLNKGAKNRQTFKYYLEETLQRSHTSDSINIFKEFSSTFQSQITNKKTTRLEAYQEVFKKQDHSKLDSTISFKQENTKKIIQGVIKDKLQFHMYTPFNYDIGVIFIKHDPESSYCAQFLNQVLNFFDRGKDCNFTSVEKCTPQNLKKEFEEEEINTQDIDFNSTLTLSLLYKLSILYSCRITSELINET